MSNIKELLIVTDEEIAKVRKKYNKSESDIKQDVAILKEWLRQQPHLPNDEDDRQLEIMLFKNKCRLEQTKKKLDKFYSFKVLYPDALVMYDVNSVKMKMARKSIITVPLPKLTDKQERIIIFKVINANTFVGVDIVLYMLMINQLCNIYDYSSADIFIADWNGFTLNAVKTFEPKCLHVFSVILMDALSISYSSVQFTNAPPHIDIFMHLAKASMKPKLFGKLKCTSRVEDIYDVVPKHILPIEYGGEEKSIYVLHEEWCKELEYQADVLKEISKKTSNEKLRIEKLQESDLFGVDGTFKKLNFY